MQHTHTATPMALEVEVILSQLEDLRDRYADTAGVRPAAGTTAPAARDYAAYDAAQAALGRMQDAAQLLSGHASSDDNPAPFEGDCQQASNYKVQRSLEIYSEDRIAAALLSTSLDSSIHPASFEVHPLGTLMTDANIRMMIRKSIHDHAANETLIESVYDHAMDMAEEVSKNLSYSERLSLEQLARQLAAELWPRAQQTAYWPLIPAP